MKKQYNYFIIIISMCAVYCVSQEFIKPKKEKKPTISVQQDAELDGDLILVGTQASGILIELSKTVFLVTKAAIVRVNDYACGEKDGCDKIERSERYAKKVKIKEKIMECINQLEQMLMTLSGLIAALDS